MLCNWECLEVISFCVVSTLIINSLSTLTSSSNSNHVERVLLCYSRWPQTHVQSSGWLFYIFAITLLCIHYIQFFRYFFIYFCCCCRRLLVVINRNYKQNKKNYYKKPFSVVVTKEKKHTHKVTTNTKFPWIDRKCSLNPLKAITNIKYTNNTIVSFPFSN